MSDNEIISAKEKEQIKFAFENAMDLLKTQKARGERIELSILKGDTPTFMEYPLAKKPQDLQGADAAILGIPFEGLTIQTPMIMAPPTCGRPPQGSVYWRMGADQGTDMIRKYSIYYSINHNRGYFPEIDKDLVF
ncbi:MAG TPA: hypothetical protein DER60_07205, partial [Syntrophomonas sp.]|nr:hypothetical protein [Syntrophomonas sp.]